MLCKLLFTAEESVVVCSAKVSCFVVSLMKESFDYKYVKGFFYHPIKLSFGFSLAMA